MGPVDWIAVVVAWAAAALVGALFYGWRAMPRAPLAQHGAAAALLFVSAVMMGHMFARVGEATLGAKPWLYPMMSGGLALTFIGPALFITAVRRGHSARGALFDCAAWLATYLAMGAAFALV